MVFKIFDASAFYAGVPFSSSEEGFTTPEVFDEIKHIKRNHQAIDLIIETGRLKILEPEKKYKEKVILTSKSTGDFQNLSPSDISVVALSLQLNGILISDDFAVFNLSNQLNILVTPIMTGGIKRIVKWDYYCAGCHKFFEALSNCPICGNQLYRKLKRNYSGFKIKRKLVKKNQLRMV